MEPFVLVLALAALPVGGHLAGGLLAERVQLDQRRLSLALHAAAGVIVGVVAVELMPRALAADAPWPVLAAFVAGALFFLGIDHVTEHVQERFSQESVREGNPWPMFVGVAMDLFTDGVMIGAGTSVSPGLGFLLAMGQVPADLPAGFATVATFRRDGIPRGRRRLLMALLAIPILVGATLGFFLLRGRPLWLQVSVLAFTAGALLTLVLEELVPQAHQDGEQRRAALYFVGGFALFFALANLFEA